MIEAPIAATASVEALSGLLVRSPADSRYLSTVVQNADLRSRDASASPGRLCYHSASVIVADLKQYLPSPSSSEGPGPAENGAVENGVVKKEPTEAATSKEESEERNRKALEKIVAAVLVRLLATSEYFCS